jgi:hypothetical protein
MTIDILYLLVQCILPVGALMLIMASGMGGVRDITKQYPLIVAIVMMAITINILMILQEIN